MPTIEKNIREIQLQIANVAKKANRNEKDIRLVAVSKRFPLSAIQDAYKSGQILFGENYIQEAQGKIEELNSSHTTSPSFHFIGHLQSNKAKLAASLFNTIETVDRLSLAKGLNKHLVKLNKKINILIQVNIGNDENKSGAMAEDTEGILKSIHEYRLDNLKICGLMTIPPFTENPEEARTYFKAMRQLGEDLAKKELFSNNEKIELSMGMSNDFHVAIEEGATLVRIGTAIFGERPPFEK